MSKSEFSRPTGTDGKGILGSDGLNPLNNLEKVALGDLDEDKLNDLAKCLFTLNNRKYGPIPGAYMVMCTKPDKEWCVAQLNADRAKPFVIFEDKVFTSIEAAQKEAEKIKKERGESAPRRCT
ncbi:hypothetical protein OAI70_01485 [Candidatus Pelagibacter sp.]|nr:hypothetical protein [Candidatus Pelagibacter sp.]